MANNFDQTEIEELVCGAVRALGVSENVFPNRPASSQRDLTDFVVCKVSGAVRDLRAIGECTVSVRLFAKDAGHAKNGRRLSVMQGRLTEGMPGVIGRLMLEGTPDILGDAPDGHGYHARFINYKTLIKTA